jgi:hypothetical protein
MDWSYPILKGQMDKVNRRMGEEESERRLLKQLKQKYAILQNVKQENATPLNEKPVATI